MKKNKILIIIIVLLIVCMMILGFFAYRYYRLSKSYEMKEQENARIEQEQKLQEEQQKAEQESFLNEKVYNNKIPIGIYTPQNGKLVLTREFSCDWSRDSIFSLFYAVASNEETLPDDDFKSLFLEYWNKNEGAENYKIGYNIKFGLDTGEVINKRILNPDDTVSLFDHIQYYLYDDVTDMPGRPYYHMRQREMTDATMLTSVKLVGYKETKGVNGPIELTVFTYDGDEDFDPDTGEYLGNSKFTTKIYREQV